jgi:outer membrane protein insertion porin family
MAAVWWLSGCGAALHLQQGQYLLRSEPAFSRGQQVVRLDSLWRNPLDNLKEIGGSTISPELLYSSVKTHPNRRMIWPKTYLHFYNLGRTLQQYEYPPETILEFFFPKSGLFDTLANFLVNTAGEPPVLVDTVQLAQDAQNLKTVYFSQGFFDAKIYARVDTCTGRTNLGKANVTFVIDEGKAAIIDKIRFEVKSDSIRKVFFRTLGDSYLVSGDNYNEEKLSAERNRITGVMRDNGFFTFNPRQISYDIDLKPTQPFGTQPNNPFITQYFPVWITIKISDEPPAYKVGKVSMSIEPATPDIEQDQFMLKISPQTLDSAMRAEYKLTENDYSDTSQVEFISFPRVIERLNLNFLQEEIDVRPGQEYSLSKERAVQRRLQSLGIFKYVLINHAINDADGRVDLIIQAVLLPKYQVKAGLEGFFKNDPILKSNLPGIGGQIGYRNKMVFKSAEKLDISAQGSVSLFRNDRDDDTLRVGWQGTATASLIFPRMLLPLPILSRLSESNANTSFSLSFSRQQNQEITRNAASLDWTYKWFHPRLGQLASSALTPMSITLIQSQLDSAYLNRIKAIENQALRTLIIQDNRSRFSSAGRYKFSWSDYQSTRNRPTYYFQGVGEIGGNMPFLIDRFGTLDGNYQDYRLGFIFYGQYLKASGEFKTFLPLDKKHSEVVVRNYVGVARPWNYTPFVPLEARFFSGGTNSMRGWQSNTLGPGTYHPSEADNVGNDLEFLVSPGGEAVFETNIELRFDAYQWIELALFTDIGNVWFLPGSEVDYEGAKFSRESYLQLGVDAGVGVRLDFSFFIFRLDVAQQLYSPSTQEIVVRRLKDLGGNQYQLNFGIGYPF